MQKKITKVVGGVLVIAALSMLSSFTLVGDSPTREAAEHGAPSAKKEAIILNTTEKSKNLVIKAPNNLRNVAKTDWQLTLVGPQVKIQKEISEKDLAPIDEGERLDKRIVADYQKLKDAAQKAGYHLSVVSGFRSVADQKAVFSQRCNQLMRQGLSQQAAIQKAKLTMTEAGYSEHHTGLALDVVTDAWLAKNPAMILDESFGNEAGAQWLAENAENYGFIIRYPKGREAITQITYEPWHLRYVSVDNAKYIVMHQLTLEQYLEVVEKWGQNE